MQNCDMSMTLYEVMSSLCSDFNDELQVSLDESSWDLHLENIETEADDEFECDCPVCIMNHDRIRGNFFFFFSFMFNF